MTATSALTEFTWHPQPAAAKFVAGLVDGFQRESPALARLAVPDAAGHRHAPGRLGRPLPASALR